MEDLGFYLRILFFGALSWFILRNRFINEHSPQNLYKQGIKAMDEGKPKIAVEKISKAITVAKGKKDFDKTLLSKMYCSRGNIYLLTKVALLSSSDFLDALECNPKNDDALNFLGVWFTMEEFNSPDYSRAIGYFTEASLINPERQDIRLNIAISKIKLGDLTGCSELRELHKMGYNEAKIAIDQLCNS